MQSQENSVINQSMNVDVLNKSNFVHLNNFRLIKISGDNAENFLQGQFTCDVLKVNNEKSSLGALCNHQGRVLAVFTLFKKENTYYCLLPHDISEQFIQHLSKYAIFSKVVLNDVTDEYFLYGCVGVNAYDFLKQNFSFEIPGEDFKVCHDNENSICKLPGAVPRYFIWSKEKKDAITNIQSWKLASILSGNAAIYAKTMSVVTPHMLNLHLLDGVSFNKGCYVGQEIVARTHYLGKSKRHLHRAEIKAEIVLEPGELVYVDNQESGVVIDSVIVNGTTYLLVVLQDPIERNFFIKELQINLR